MQVTIETPQGSVTATVQDGFIGNAQIDPDGVVTITFFPMEKPPDEGGNDGFITD